MTLPAAFTGLRVKLILLTTLALLPLGLIALWQTYQEIRESHRLTERLLIDTTRVAASDQRAQIKQAIGAGYGLGTVARIGDLTTCRQSMSRFVGADPSVAFAGFIPVNGLMECSSSGDTVVDFSGYKSLQDAIDRRGVYVEVNGNGAVSGQAVVIVNVPVFEDNALLGFVSLSMPQNAVKIPGQDADDIILAAIGTSNEVFVLSEGVGAPETFMPRDLSPADVATRAGTSFVAQNASDQSRVFSVTEPISDSYVIVGSWAQATVLDTGVWRQAFMPVLFAVLMWAASMAVAYLGMDRLVLRHLADLRSAMRQFALGERNSDGLALNNAPTEFQDAERAFNRMALLITEAEARQMTDLHDKEVLLREVHHRVKNNLQMIASIMNLQARAARKDEVREVLGGLQRRVRGLATLHRSLYTEAETSRIDAQELVAAVVSETSSMVPDPSVSISTDLASAMLYPDQAVPLSMWLAEALTNAVKYVGRDERGAVFISVAVEVGATGMVTLRIENSTGKPLVDGQVVGESTGLGTKLMMAFSRQLEGEVEAVETEGRYLHTLRFQIQDFNPESDDVKPDASSSQTDTAAA